MTTGTTIETLHPVKKSGVEMHEKIYDLVSDFILITVHNEKELTMIRLIENADLNFPDPLEGNLAWHIYHVRLDLEARGLLKIETIETGSRHRMQVLQLTRKGIELFRKRFIFRPQGQTQNNCEV